MSPLTTTAPTPRSPILLVEDDLEGADAVRQYLEFRGYDVDVCTTAEDALLRSAARDYGVVITDLHLPGMRGEELAQRLLQRSTVSPPRLIALSGEHGPAQAPFHARLGKPCRPKELIAALEALLQRACP